MKINKEDWVVGRKYRFIGGYNSLSSKDSNWTLGQVYSLLSDVDYYVGGSPPDAKFTGDSYDDWCDISCFEPVREPEMSKLYVVASVRKSDGAVFLKDSSHKPYTNFELAKKEVERCASTQSSDYVYYVYELVGVMSAEKEFPPVKTKWF